MMEFLYFPENKMEYIPAVLSLIFFMTLAYFTFKYFKKNSQAQEEKLKAFEQEVMERLKEDKDRESRI
ncbi:hypothetical protein [Macrococcus armenti]|uniref:hypothetical protein n=1 Tax=Macrococcus armenti TaxID=2875764 RepID=UPI001CCDD307|nr:hypothetical protein [Macrococcus armenti]UBH16019.1 hypothetical protein LAU44_03475 [Macrococcus armenti]UBH18380.1 hypothetical protein LAU39_03485 [Macrococcus armenti]UBH20646.1 hypothetical protein LAU40_03475 [Macrococcus armenti]